MVFDVLKHLPEEETKAVRLRRTGRQEGRLAPADALGLAVARYE